MLCNMLLFQAQPLLAAASIFPQSSSEVQDMQAAQHHKPINVVYSGFIMKHSM